MNWYCNLHRLTILQSLLLLQLRLIKGRPHGRTQGYFASYFCMCTNCSASYTYNSTRVCVRVRRPPRVLDFLYVVHVYDVQKYKLAVFRWAFWRTFIEKVTCTLIFVYDTKDALCTTICIKKKFFFDIVLKYVYDLKICRTRTFVRGQRRTKVRPSGRPNSSDILRGQPYQNYHFTNRLRTWDIFFTRINLDKGSLNYQSHPN